MPVHVDGHRIDGAGALEPLLGDWPADLARWADRVALRRGSRVAVKVSDHHTRYWLCTPPAGLSGLAELKAVAAARFEAVFHARASGWAIEADWQPRQAFLCAALPVALAAGWHALSARKGWRLQALVPAAITALNGMVLPTTGTAWALCFRDDGFHALLLDGGRPRDVRQHWTDEPPTRTDVLARLQAQALVAGVAMPERMVVAGPAPQGWGAA